MDLLQGVDMAKLMMGERAFQIGLNLIVQGYQPEEKVAGVFQARNGFPLLHGSDKSHVVVLGDAIIRPRIVIATNEFRGRGIEDLFTNGFLDAAELIRRGNADILLRP